VSRVRVVNPVATASVRAVNPSPHPASLTGQVLGIVVNGKEYSEAVLRRMAERLCERHGLQDVLWWDKQFPAKPAPFLEEVARRSTIVLTGVGH
jgi:hypothetical protein